MTEKMLLCNLTRRVPTIKFYEKGILHLLPVELPRDSFESIMKMPYRRVERKNLHFKQRIIFQRLGAKGKHQLLIFRRRKPEKQKKKTLSLYVISIFAIKLFSHTKH